MKKYELLNETIRVGGHILHRIIAVRSFGDVSVGERGGFIESERNLSHSGNCWVYGDAMLYGGYVACGDIKIGNKKPHAKPQTSFKPKVAPHFVTPKPSKKYGFTGETKYCAGRTLRRIVALCNFGNVKRGERGGFIESERNLAQNGHCWVANNAMVYGYARVGGNARVEGSAQVYDCAEVKGSAKIYGNAKICDYAQANGNAHIFGYAKVCNYAKIIDTAHIFENATIFGDAMIYGSTWICGSYNCGRTYGDGRLHNG